MRFLILGGTEIGITELGQPMDDWFDKLHAAYLGTTPLSWSDFMAAAIAFFDANPAAPGLHNAYFNNFTVLWRTLLATGKYDEAEHLWERAAQPALEWEQSHQGQRIHKGTLYYFWAMTALLRGDIDHGYLLAHQALDEDIRTSGQSLPDTPAYALVSLSYDQVHQAFRQWVQEQAIFLNDLINNHNTTYNRAFTIRDVKLRFFEAPPGADTLFLFTYTLARLMKIANLPGHAVSNPFASQLQANLLFNITLVIDAAIKAKNPGHWKFIDHAEHLPAKAMQPLTIAQLQAINAQFQSDFDATLCAALDGTLTTQPNRALTRLQCDAALTYGFRNHGAHNTGAATTIWTRFHDVTQCLFRTLFATIEHLY